MAVNILFQTLISKSTEFAYNTARAEMINDIKRLGQGINVIKHKNFTNSSLKFYSKTYEVKKSMLIK